MIAVKFSSSEPLNDFVRTNITTGSFKGQFVIEKCLNCLCFFTARALHRELEWRNHNVTWPHTTIPVTEVTNVILKRINEASVRIKITTFTLILFFRTTSLNLLLIPNIYLVLIYQIVLPDHVYSQYSM